MTRRGEGTPSPRARLQVALRAACTVLAVVVGIFAVWLIVTAETQKGTRLGALSGFWALLLAVYGVFGTRRPVLLAQPGQSLELRAGAELSRVEDAAERREYEYRLAEMLRREVHATMGAELATLRADVAALRSELVEKVGGQLRLERIETTRVIGSDIEALQHEVRQLMVGRQPNEVGTFSLGTSHTALISGVQERPVFAPSSPPAAYPNATSQTVASAPLAREPIASELFAPRPVPPRPAQPAAMMTAPHTPSPPDPFTPAPGPLRPGPEPFAPEPFAPQPPAPEPIAPQPAPQPLAPEPITPEPITPEPADPQPISPAPRPSEAEVNSDPFASMPRLRPFTDFELDPIEPEPAHDPHSGRRRRADGPVPVNGGGVAAPTNGGGVAAPTNGGGNGAGEHPGSGSGRHANANGDVHVDTAGGGGRRRRAADGADDDVLARILHRETAR